jgi:hypothetical protein
MISQVAKCERQMLKKILRVKKKINKIIGADEVS